MSLLNWTPAGVSIDDEAISGIDANPVHLEHDTFYDHTGHEIEVWTGAGKTGTQLTEGVDYSVGDEDTDLTADAGNPVYQTVTILNSAYHYATLAGPLYFWYETVGDYVDADDMNDALNHAGMIAPFAMASAPSGWLSCDGSAVSRSTYARLFAAIGTTWGVGDGSTTFNVPDLRAAFLRGTGSHGSETMANGNPYAGPAVGATEDDQMQGHEHTVAAKLNASGGTSNFTLSNTGTGTTDNNVTIGIETDGVNGTPRTGDETRPFSAGVHYCIKM